MTCRHLNVRETISELIFGDLVFYRMVNGLVYFGCSLAVDDLGGNIYRDYIFGSIIEFPAALAAIFGCM